MNTKKKLIVAQNKITVLAIKNVRTTMRKDKTQNCCETK